MLAEILRSEKCPFCTQYRGGPLAYMAHSFNVINQRAGQLATFRDHLPFVFAILPTTIVMPDNSKEERINLALEAYKKGFFPSRNAAAKAYDVPLSTFKSRVNGTTCRKESVANGRKLTPTEEKTLSLWIIDMGQRGPPLQIPTVRYLAQLLLSARLSSHTVYVGDHWVTRYIKRHTELFFKYSKKYDYQRAKCEDPELMMGWYERFYDAIEKYGILEQDIYNIDETGFHMSIASIAKVICGSETRKFDARAIQPGNREWVTAIIAVNASGWALCHGVSHHHGRKLKRGFRGLRGTREVDYPNCTRSQARLP